jgi:hypothetical protein
MKYRFLHPVVGAALLALPTIGTVQAHDTAYSFKSLTPLGSAAPGGDILRTDFEVGDLNTAGELAFDSQVDGGDAAYLVDPDGKLTLLTRPGRRSLRGHGLPADRHQ